MILDSWQSLETHDWRMVKHLHVMEYESTVTIGNDDEKHKRKQKGHINKQLHDCLETRGISASSLGVE